VNFNLETQKLSVGTWDNKIIIYDLKTAVKWKILEGHNSPVTILEFNTSGTLLASFSMGD
jgi:WD40 repeat protein